MRSYPNRNSGYSLDPYHPLTKTMSDDSDVVIVEKEDGSPPADEAPVVNAPEPASQPQSAPPAESSLRQRNAPASAVAPVKSRDDDDLFIAPAQSTAEVLARLASLKLQIDGELANPTPAPKHGIICQSVIKHSVLYWH